MTQPSWDTEALQRFPDLVGQFEGVTSMYALWNELADAFKQAYQPPRNDELIERIYSFAKWCCAQPSGSSAEDDLQTCVNVCFLEEIPTIQLAVADMPRWFTEEDVHSMKATFSRLVGDSGYSAILSAFTHPLRPHPNADSGA